MLDYGIHLSFQVAIAVWELQFCPDPSIIISFLWEVVCHLKPTTCPFVYIPLLLLKEVFYIAFPQVVSNMQSFSRSLTKQNNFNPNVDPFYLKFCKKLLWSHLASICLAPGHQRLDVPLLSHYLILNELKTKGFFFDPSKSTSIVCEKLSPLSSFVKPYAIQPWHDFWFCIKNKK